MRGLCQRVALCTRPLPSLPPFLRRGIRHKWDMSDAHLDMFVRGDPNYGKLASGILLRLTKGLSTNLDVMGDASASSAAKAVALAQSFHEKEEGHELVGNVVFTPMMVSRQDRGEGPLKVLRLQLALAPSPALHKEPRDFSKGGMFVPNATGGAFGPDAAAESSSKAGSIGTRQRAIADAYRPLRADTPTEMSRAIIHRWRRYVSDAAASSTSSSSSSKPQQQQP